MKRSGVLGRARYFGGGLAVIGLVAITLFVVLPAFASTQGDKVPPASGAGITPVDVPVGGNGNCSNLFPTMSNVQELDVPNPVSGSYASGHGWNFTITAGTLSGFNKNSGQSLAVSSGGHAAILGIGINGGTDSLIYDYRTLPVGFVTADTNLHAPASKFTSGTNPETGITQYYGVSHLTVCYGTPLATISGNAYKDVPGQPGIGGLTVTLKDITRGGTQTTTTASTGTVGNYSFSALAGDDYSVCVSSPGFTNVQSVPSTDFGSCHSTTGTNGYKITNLAAGGSSGNNFGFQPQGTVSGTVYQDVNGPKGGGPDGAYEAGTDTTLQGWSVSLYDGSGNIVGSPTTSGANGSYSLSTLFDPTQTYTVCVTPPNPPGGTFAQSEPLPTAPNSCATLGGLQKGQQFTPSSAGANVTENFGVDPSVAEPTPCPQSPFGFDNTATGGSELQIQLAACKPNQTFVFDSGKPGDPNYPWVSVWAGDQTQPLVPLIEKVVFPDPIVNGAPSLQHIAYTDAFPYDPAKAEQMAFCKSDPRVPGSSMDLPQGFTDQEFQTVLPATNAGTQTPATSCLISLRTYVDANGNSWLEAYVASDIDGFTKGIG